MHAYGFSYRQSGTVLTALPKKLRLQNKGDEASDVILEIFNIGELPIGSGIQAYLNNTEFVNLFENIREIYDYCEKTSEYRYGDDYLGNFMLVYSVEEQLILGLR